MVSKAVSAMRNKTAATPEPEIEGDGEPTKVSSRDGKVSFTIWLPASYKRSIMLVRANTGETQEALFAKALNMLFENEGVPTVQM